MSQNRLFPQQVLHGRRLLLLVIASIYILCIKDSAGAGLLQGHIEPIVPASSKSAVKEQQQYILITRQSLSGEFQRLVDRRASQGFDAALVTVEQIDLDFQGGDIQEKIRNCIRTFYDPSIPLFVALGGDAVYGNTSDSMVPVRFCNSRYEDAESADLYYADMDGGTWDADGDGIYGEPEDVTLTELTPEICLGRIPVRTAEQAKAYIDKVIRYEEAPLEGFANSLIFVRGTHSGVLDMTGDARPAGFRDHDPVTKEEMEQTQYYVNSIQPRWQAVPLDLFFNTRGPLDQFICGDDDLTREHFIEQLSQGNEGRGYHIIRHGGHGRYTGMGIGREGGLVKTGDIAQLTNSVPGIMISSCCGVAGFDKAEPCIGEAFIRNPNGGTVAFFGAARSSGANHIAGKLIERIFDPESLYLGEIMKFAQTAGVSSYIEDPYKPYIYTFLGDPAIKRLGIEPGRKVQVFQPGGCEIIDIGDDITIRWNATGTDFGPSEKVKLEYSDDSGQSWFSIPGAEELPYDGRFFVWQNCPLPEGIHYRIRVSCLSYPDIMHYPQRDFSITNLGLLTIQSYPYTKLWIGGTHSNATNYTYSATVGQTVSLMAPEVTGDLGFQGWFGPGGELLSAEPEWNFEFAGDTTAIASYGYPTRIQYYVNDDEPEGDFAAGNDLNDGLSLQTPKRHINTLLLNDPNIGAGDVIYISAGIYTENISLGPTNNGLLLVGTGSGLTEINGQYKAACITLSQCGHIAITGIRLTEGIRGLYCDGSTCMVTDCEFLNNSTDARGGGLWCNGSRILLSGCRFTGNEAKRGGGIMLKLNNNVLMSGCRLEANKASKEGGGLYMRENNYLRVINGLIAGNKGSRGGGFYILGKSTVKITNSTFVEGIVGSDGGALYVTSSDSPSDVRVKNCIICAGSKPVAGPETVKIEYSDIRGGWPGEGNIDADPCFVQPGYWANDIWVEGDYHLKSCIGRWDPLLDDWTADDEHSPCIDAGSEDSDWTKELWPNGVRINLGTYGGTAEASKSYTSELFQATPELIRVFGFKYGK
jgi:hypothetical protein